MNFKQFFEESNIHIRKRLDFRDGHSEVTFDIDGKEYTYHIETGSLLYNKTLQNMEYAPGKALNAIKKIGKLISKSGETVQ